MFINLYQARAAIRIGDIKKLCIEKDVLNNDDTYNLLALTYDDVVYEVVVGHGIDYCKTVLRDLCNDINQQVAGR